jgi:hypothetical protein
MKAIPLHSKVRLPKWLIGIMYHLTWEVIFLAVPIVAGWLFLHSINETLRQLEHESRLLNDAGFQLIAAGYGYVKVRRKGWKLIGKK